MSFPSLGLPPAQPPQQTLVSFTDKLQGVNCYIFYGMTTGYALKQDISLNFASSYLCNCVTGVAGVAVPQVLQQLREFDAPAMQSCKPLPCGTGSCQNRRLREQTLNRKPCHCGSIKGG